VHDGAVQLRDTTEADLDTLFDLQDDDESRRMAAFAPHDTADRAAYVARHRQYLRDEDKVTKTVVVDGEVVGSVAKFVMDGEAEVTYLIRRDQWGRGLASAALAGLLDEVRERPLFARVATDNVGSARVLERNGFVRVGEDSGFASARNAETAEYVYRLD
jgi:[ribosomal protein S5]-alanine N-acetyltransferase